MHPKRYMRVSTFDDARYLAPRLRKCDKEEIKASHNVKPVTALMLGVLNSDYPLSIIDGDKVVGMFGVVPTEHFASIWMLGSDDLQDISISFLRECRGVVEMFNKKHHLLANCVSAENKLHIKWLRWCGFKFIKLHERYGYEQKPFYEFVRLNNV